MGKTFDIGISRNQIASRTPIFDENNIELEHLNWTSGNTKVGELDESLLMGYFV